MRPPNIVFTLVAVLLAKLARSAIAICLLGAPVPARSAANDRLPLETGDHATLDAYIQARMRAAHIPGLALGVVRGDQIVYLKGYGVAGPDGRAVTPQTPFILGSTSKSITALAVMQLVEAVGALRRREALSPADPLLIAGSTIHASRRPVGQERRH